MSVRTSLAMPTAGRIIAERAAQYGVHTLTEAELVAAVAGIDPDAAAESMLVTGGLRALLTASSVPNMTARQFSRLQASLELARRHYNELMRAGPALLNPRATREYLRMRLRDLSHEVFVVLYLDSHHRVIECQELFRGTIDGATVHCREVVKAALAKNAAAVIFAHNHPSGVAEPSQADELITRRLKDSLSTVDIRVLDHLVIGDDTCTSMAERGML